MDEKKYCINCRHIGSIIRIDGKNYVQCDSNPIEVHDWEGIKYVKLLCCDKNRFNDCADYEYNSCEECKE